MMKIWKGPAFVLLALTLLLCLSQFFSKTPPAGVLVTLFRLPYQYLAQWILPASSILALVMIIEIFRKKFMPGILNMVLVCMLLMTVILSAVYMLRINGAKIQWHCLPEQTEPHEDGQYSDNVADENLKKSLKYKMIDESKNAQMEQLFIYIPENSDVHVALIHINYGGWSVQSADTGMYLEHLCEQQGYAFVQLAGIGKENGSLIDIVKSIREGIAYIQKHYGFEKTYLVGSSAGGHLALVSAFADSVPELSEGTEITVDGVIALYAPVDLEYQYQYFVLGNPAKDIFGKMGDALYCKLFQGSSGTLGGETAKIQEAFLGEYSDQNKLYQMAKIENLIQDQKIPVLFIQGDKDSQLGLEDKERIYAELSKQGIPYAVLNLPGVDHAFDMVFPETTIAGKRSIQEIQEWISKVEVSDGY